MSVNRPDNQTLYQMAEAELRKLPQFKNSIAPIPTYLIKIKIDEFNRLKPEELQQKINEYFSSTENKPKGWAVFGLELSDKQNQNKPTQVTQYKSQNGKISPNDKNVREFAANLLLNNIVNANEKLENYRNGFGYISSDAVYHGLSNIGDWTWDAFTGRDDFKGYHEKSNDLAKQKTMLQELTNLTSTKIEFEKKFKEIFGIDFDIEAFQNLQQASDDLNKLNTYEALSNRFKNSIDVINKNEGEFNFVSAMALVGPLFGNNMIKANEFVSNLEKDCSTDEEFKEKLIAVLSNAKNEADRNVAMISVKTPREHLEANYKQAYKNAMGDYHSSDDIDKFIEVSQRNTMYTEMAIIIASSTLTMGSSAVQGLGAKAVTKFGAKAGGHIFKAGMTAATASLSSVETVVSGLTSKDGLTSAKLSEAGEQLKSGLIFGAFGAYVSGPIGDKVVSLLKSNPNITSSIMQKVFSGVGFGTEITADALFELGLRGGDIETLFAENASGEALGRFMNMILGGRAHHASKALLDNISLKQDIDTDGKPKYSVIQDGKVVFETKDSNELVAGITSIAAEAQGLKIDDLDTKEQSAKQSTETIETTSQPLTRESVQEMKQSGRNVTTMPDGTVVEYINGRAVEIGKVEGVRTKQEYKPPKTEEVDLTTKNDLMASDTETKLSFDGDADYAAPIRMEIEPEPESSRNLNNTRVDNNATSRPIVEEPTTTSKPSDKPTIKGLEVLTPSVEADALKLTGEILTREVPNPNKPGETMRVLTDEAETLVWKASEDLRENALKVENQIVGYMHDAGLGTSETLKHRSKSLQSLHDKIKNYLAENPNKTLDDAIRDVRDYVATRTINESSNVRNHPDVVELIEKGDLKSAMSKAVEIESEYVLASLKGIIDKMADGTADIMITRISNYMGEDGIPYFTEKQLDQLRTYAHDKGVDIPIISRVTDVNERASVGDVYSDDASTKIRKSGYTAFQMNFVTKDGDVFEWQYRGDKLNDFGEGEHVPYDLRTGKDIIGKDVILTDLYQPMKELLTNKDLMPDDLYKEYNAYLTAHYRYLREVELGFAEPNNPPKLPAGLDTRLRADNLVLLHNIAEKLKKGELTKDEALKQYNEGLIQNTVDNVTTESYRAQLKETSANASVDRHEARIRLGESDSDALLKKACMDKDGNIKNNLIIVAEDLRSKGIQDETITAFLNRFKNDDGTIDDDVFKDLNSFINMFSPNKQIDEFIMELYTITPLKNGQKIIDTDIANKLFDVFKTYNLPLSHLKEIAQVIPTLDLNKNPYAIEGLGAFTADLLTGNTQSMLTNKEHADILKSIIHDGIIDDKAATLAVELSKTSILKENISKIIIQAKDPVSGFINPETLNFLTEIINPFKQMRLNSNYVNRLLNEVLKSIKSTNLVSTNGKITTRSVINPQLIDEFKQLMNNLPKISTEKYDMEKIYRTAMVLNSVKYKNGTINQGKLNLAKNLINCKFSLNSIPEVMLRCSDKYGNLIVDKINKYFLNFNSLSKEDRANLEIVDIKSEDGIIRQTMKFKDGSTRVFDIDANNTTKKNIYDITTKDYNRSRYTKLRDSVRGKSTKTISKNGQLISEITIIQDKDGNKIGTEYAKLSSIQGKGGRGIVDVRFRDNDGNTIDLCTSNKDADGNITISKDFTSTNGTRTQENYFETPNGSTQSRYIITDATGKTILDETRTFEVLDDTHFVSTINGNRYEISVDDLNVLTVTNDKGEKVRFDLDNFTHNNYARFKELLKQIPGHEFFNMAKVQTEGFSSTQTTNNAHYTPTTNNISFGENHDYISVFFHEFGHNKDWRINANDKSQVIRYNDKEFLDIYERERKAFIEEFPTLQRDFIAYFISLDNASSRKNQSAAEVIAEVNNILSTPYQANGLEFRKYYLQRYFPETIAYMAKKLNPDVYNN